MCTQLPWQGIRGRYSLLRIALELGRGARKMPMGSVLAEFSLWLTSGTEPLAVEGALASLVTSTQGRPALIGAVSGRAGSCRW